MLQSKLWIFDSNSVCCLFDAVSLRCATSWSAGRFLLSLVNCNTYKSYVANCLFGEFSSQSAPQMGADHLKIGSSWDGRPVKSTTGWVFSWLRRLIVSGTQLISQRARIPPERGHMSDMLSPAVSDSERYDDNSEAESWGRNRLGRDWLESPESVLFDEFSEISEVSWSFAASRSLLSPLPQYARSRTERIWIWPISAPGSRA